MRIKSDPADVAFSQYIRAKYPRCQVCGKPSTQVHHFKGRRFQSVRFSEDNAWAVCFTCHRRFHEEPDWAVWQQMNRLGGQSKYDLFIFNTNQIKQRSSVDKKEIAKHFRDELKKLKGE
jgi:5-methylcytosine-specific restriction endonuclease McrA